MPKLIKKITGEATESTYQDLLTINPNDLQEFAKIGAFVRETGASWKAYIKILAGMDGTNYPYTLMAETELASGGTAIIFETITDPWLYIKIQAKDFSGGVHATLEAYFTGA